MFKHSKKYKKIVDELVEKSFPELRGKWIFVYHNTFLKMTALAVKIFFIKGIFFGNKCLKFSLKEIKSVSAHELSHLIYFGRMNFFEYILKGFFLFFNEKNIIQTENFADKEAIRRGYARGLYSNRLIWWKEYTQKDKRIANRYLSPKEIKQYAQKIGKW